MTSAESSSSKRIAPAYSRRRTCRKGRSNQSIVAVYPCRPGPLRCVAGGGEAAEVLGDLAVAQAAVVAGNPFRQQYPEAAPREAVSRQLEQAAVLEHPAREPGHRDAGARPLGLGDPADRIGERRVGRASALARVEPIVTCTVSSSGAQSIRSTPSASAAIGSSGKRSTGRAQASSHIGPWPSKLVSVTPSTSAARASNTRPAALERGALMPRSHAARTIGSGTGTGHAIPLPSTAPRRCATATGRPCRLPAAGSCAGWHVVPSAGTTDEGLAAPQGAIRPVAHAVPGEHDRGLADVVLRNECRGVGVVVKHRRPRFAQRAHPARRRVARVRIAKQCPPARRRGAAGRAPPARTPARCAACPCRPRAAK